MTFLRHTLKALTDNHTLDPITDTERASPRVANSSPGKSHFS